MAEQTTSVEATVREIHSLRARSYPVTVTGAKPSALLHCRKPVRALATVKPVDRWSTKRSCLLEAF